MKNLLKKVAIVLGGAGFLNIIISAIFFSWRQVLFNFNEPIDTGKFAEFGDYIAGTTGTFWTLASLILFYLSLGIEKERHESENLSYKRNEILHSINRLFQTHFDMINALQYNHHGYFQGFAVIEKFASDSSIPAEIKEIYLEPILNNLHLSLQTIENSNIFNLDDKSTQVDMLSARISFYEKRVYEHIFRTRHENDRYQFIIDVLAKYNHFDNIFKVWK